MTNPQPPVFADTSPAVSPDGRSLVFLRRTSWGAGELHLLPLGRRSDRRRRAQAPHDRRLRADYPAWMPDGEEIVFSAKGSLWRLAVSGGNAPTRIPYVGEDGLMPAISRPQPGQAGSPGLRPQLRRREFLAHRDVRSGCAILIGAGAGDLVDEIGLPLPSFRRTADASPSPRPLGRSGDLGL